MRLNFQRGAGIRLSLCRKRRSQCFYTKFSLSILYSREKGEKKTQKERDNSNMTVRQKKGEKLGAKLLSKRGDQDEMGNSERVDGTMKMERRRALMLLRM